MTLDEQELENCRREIKRLTELRSHYSAKLYEYSDRVEAAYVALFQLQTRIEAAKGSTDG